MRTHFERPAHDATCAEQGRTGGGCRAIAHQKLLRRTDVSQGRCVTAGLSCGHAQCGDQVWARRFLDTLPTPSMPQPEPLPGLESLTPGHVSLSHAQARSPADSIVCPSHCPSTHTSATGTGSHGVTVPVQLPSSVCKNMSGITQWVPVTWKNQLRDQPVPLNSRRNRLSLSVLGNTQTWQIACHVASRKTNSNLSYQLDQLASAPAAPLAPCWSQTHRMPLSLSARSRWFMGQSAGSMSWTRWIRCPTWSPPAETFWVGHTPCDSLLGLSTDP